MLNHIFIFFLLDRAGAVNEHPPRFEQIRERMEKTHLQLHDIRQLGFLFAPFQVRPVTNDPQTGTGSIELKCDRNCGSEICRPNKARNFHSGANACKSKPLCLVTNELFFVGMNVIGIEVAFIFHLFRKMRRFARELRKHQALSFRASDSRSPRPAWNFHPGS